MLLASTLHITLSCVLLVQRYVRDSNDIAIKRSVVHSNSVAQKAQISGRVSMSHATTHTGGIKQPKQSRKNRSQKPHAMYSRTDSTKQNKAPISMSATWPMRLLRQRDIWKPYCTPARGHTNAQHTQVTTKTVRPHPPFARPRRTS